MSEDNSEKTKYPIIQATFKNNVLISVKEIPLEEIEHEPENEQEELLNLRLVDWLDKVEREGTMYFLRHKNMNEDEHVKIMPWYLCDSSNDLIIGEKTFRNYRFSYSELVSTDWREIKDE